jgi:neutral ceramidase
MILRTKMSLRVSMSQLNSAAVNRRPDRLLGLFALAVLIVSGGCSSHRIRVPQYTLAPPPPTPSPSQFIAGAAKVDITPPPGFPLAGHSISAGVARGYWTKLYARAFYFRDTDGRVLALVSCELYGVPAGLRSEVLRRLNVGWGKDTNGKYKEHVLPEVYLPPESLILAATHTHHGPGGYMTSAVYNGFGAALPGFDPVIYETYAERITDAVRQAETKARHAEEATIEVRQGSAPNLQRNRAIGPFFLNPDRNTVRGLAQAGGVQCDSPRLCAVDPTLTTLRISHKDVTDGLLVFYAIHPTAMSHENPLYSSDLTGRAMATLEQQYGAIAGFFNGAEGDVSPDWDRQNRDDVLKFGKKLAEAVTDLQGKQALPTKAPVTLRAAINKFANNWNFQVPNDQPKFAYEPTAGAALIGGAEDGRTAFLYVEGWRAGITSPTPTGRNGDQGFKEPALGAPVTTLLNNLDAKSLSAIPMYVNLTQALTNHGFPAQVPIMVAQIGDLVTLASIPVEMTTTMGMRVRDSLKDKAPSGRVVIVGLANEYFSYTTTPEEYAAQQYEGASTVAGPQEGRAIEVMLAEVSGGLVKPKPAPSTKTGPAAASQQQLPAEEYSVGAKRKLAFSPMLLGKPRNMVDEDLEPLLPPELAHHESQIPRVRWSESKDNDWKTGERFIRIRDAEGNEIERDGSPNFLVVMVDSGEVPPRSPGCFDGQRCWNALWIPKPEPVIAPDKSVYFEVTTVGKNDPTGKSVPVTLCSVRFQLDALPQDALPRPLPASEANCSSMSGR